MRQYMTIETTIDAQTLLVASPIRWIHAGDDGEDGEMTALSVGTLDGKQRKEPVAVLHGLATRVATHSSISQSQRTETTTLPSRPAASKGQIALQTDVPNGHAPPPSDPVPNGHITPESRPTSMPPAPATDLGTASLRDQPMPGSGVLQQPLANGGPPESKPQTIDMPPPPSDLERQKTDFFTPPSDPAELKQIQ